MFVDRDWFQLLLKGCTIEAGLFDGDMSKIVEFQLLLKGCTIEAQPRRYKVEGLGEVSVVVERMYD